MASFWEPWSIGATGRPATLYKYGDGYIQLRNFVEKTQIDEATGEERTYYECEKRTLTEKEYKDTIIQMGAVDSADSQTKLLNNQEISEEQQLSIMEATAEIYETNEENNLSMMEAVADIYEAVTA